MHSFQKVFQFSVCISTLTVTTLFVLSYVDSHHSWIPIGWDTPRYVGQVRSLLDNGLPSFVDEMEYYNVGYAIVASSLAFSGISPFVVEMVLPPVLCAFLIVISGVFAKNILKDPQIAILVVLLTATWFAVYRLGADLHPNLMALVFLLLVSHFLFTGYIKSRGTVRRILSYSLLFFASFTHIETTMFFTAILSFSLLLLHRLDSSRFPRKKTLFDIVLMILLILPASIVFIEHLRHLRSYAEGAMAIYPPATLVYWITSIGLAFPIQVLGLILLLRNVRRNEQVVYSTFVVLWTVSSSILACVEYFLPSFHFFSNRALLLFPVPFVGSIGLNAISSSISKAERPLSHIKLISLRSIGAMAFMIIILASSTTFTWIRVKSEGHFNVYISASAYDKLTWLSINHVPEKPPIFVFNDHDRWAGELAELSENWVQAIYGDHHSYLGFIDYLVSLAESPYDYPVSQRISAIFFDKMKKEGILMKEALLLHQIIVVTDFYLPKPLPSYDRAIFDELHNGIFVLNTSKLESRSGIYVPLYLCVKSKEGHWYPIEKNWTESIYALELWNPTPTKRSHCEILFPISQEQTYSFELRYWDASEGEMILELDGIPLGSTSHTGTERPLIFATTSTLLSEGVHSLKITIRQDAERLQYACLDFLKILQTHG